MRLPRQLYLAEQVRALDQTAIERFHTPGIQLMERAGLAAFRHIRRHWPRARKIQVFCGAGNNGGDGFVVARLAVEANLDVQVYLLAEVTRLKGDAKSAYEKLLKAGCQCVSFKAGVNDEQDIIVDGLLGTGLSGEVGGQYREAIQWINRARQSKNQIKVIALDIPSGLHADTGCIQGVAVKADLTVTFIGVKQGLLTCDGPDQCGELCFDDLDVDPQVYNEVSSSCRMLSDDIIPALLKPRRKNSHKTSFGHVLVIGGNDGMIGAVRMAAEAALRAGAGMVSVATRPEYVSAVVSHRPEIMCYGILSHHQLAPLLNKKTCVAVGPGLGQDAWATEIFSRVLESELPMVIDADALNLLAKDKIKKDNWVLTPHPGEASRLLAKSTGEIQANRFAAAMSLHQQYGGAVVLKGTGSLVIDEAGNQFLCPYGNTGMASAGMGDVLTGIAVAMIAQGLSVSEAAKVAVVVHAMAGDLAARKDGQRGMVASDLFPYIRRLVNSPAIALTQTD